MEDTCCLNVRSLSIVTPKSSTESFTIEGHKHLGAALGSRSFLEEYVGEKVDKWVNEVTKLADFAISQPQASNAAFTFGLRHRWT